MLLGRGFGGTKESRDGEAVRGILRGLEMKAIRSLSHQKGFSLLVFISLDLFNGPFQKDKNL